MSGLETTELKRVVGGRQRGDQYSNKGWKVEQHGEKWRGDCLPTTAGEEERSCQQTLKRAIQTRSHTKGNLNPVKFVPDASYYSPVKGRLRQHFLLLCAQLHSSRSSSGTNCMVWEPSPSLLLSPLPHCTELRSWHIHQRSCGIHCYLHWAGEVARQLYRESICTYRQ